MFSRQSLTMKAEIDLLHVVRLDLNLLLHFTELAVPDVQTIAARWDKPQFVDTFAAANGEGWVLIDQDSTAGQTIACR